MPGRHASQNCSIARALAVVGERWTLLVVRELSLGRRRFREILEGTGIATNVLSDRLDRLVDEGVVRRIRVPVRGVVHDYELTEAGLDLLPVLGALMRWGDRHAGGRRGPPRVWRHLECGELMDPEMVCSHCRRPLTPEAVQVLPGPGASARQRREGPLPYVQSSSASHA